MAEEDVTATKQEAEDIINDWLVRTCKLPQDDATRYRGLLKDFGADSLEDLMLVKESEWNAKQEERGSLENKQQKNKGDLDQEIDEKIVMLMEKIDGKTWKCKLCDKTGQKSSISQHCEARHLMGYSHPCHLCDHKTATRNALKGHIRVKHSGK